MTYNRPLVNIFNHFKDGFKKEIIKSNLTTDELYNTLDLCGYLRYYDCIDGNILKYVIEKAKDDFKIQMKGKYNSYITECAIDVWSGFEKHEEIDYYYLVEYIFNEYYYEEDYKDIDFDEYEVNIVTISYKDLNDNICEYNHLINCKDFIECMQLYGIEFGYHGYINDW